MDRESDETKIARDLLAYLRRTVGEPTLGYAAYPERITGGFDTTIYGFRLSRAPPPLAGELVLRVYRLESGDLPARFEGAVHSALAARGYPAPRALVVGDARSEIGRAFLILERVPGRNLLDLVLSPHLFSVPELLAGAQIRLHELDAAEVERDLAAQGFPTECLHPAADLVADAAAIGRIGLGSLRPGLDWLVARKPAETARPVICHGDFHPLNVLVLRGMVSGVIDWSRMRIAEPAYDVGATIALLSQGPIDLPRFLSPLARVGRRALVDVYRRAYQRRCALDPEALGWYEALRCLGFLIEAGERRLAEAGLVAMPSKPTAFAAPRTIERILARFWKLTSVRLRLP